MVRRVVFYSYKFHNTGLTMELVAVPPSNNLFYSFIFVFFGYD